METASDHPNISPPKAPNPVSTGRESGLTHFERGDNPADAAPEESDKQALGSMEDSHPDETDTAACLLSSLLKAEGKAASRDLEEDTREEIDPVDRDKPTEAFVEQPAESRLSEYTHNSSEDSDSSIENSVNSFQEETPARPDSELHYLNQDDIGETAIVGLEDEELISLYEDIHQRDALVGDEKSWVILKRFLPESLLDMQTIGFNMTEWMNTGILESLSLLLPVQVNIKPVGLSNAMVLLIEPHPREGGMIELKPVPFLQDLPAIPLSEKQKKAVAEGSPFWMFSRVVHPESSQEYHTSHDELWEDLSATLGLDRPTFDEILRQIFHAPTQVEAGLTYSFWAKERREELIRLVDLRFPLQVAFFTGIHLMFYPFDEIIHFPAWKELIQQASESY